MHKPICFNSQKGKEKVTAYFYTDHFKVLGALGHPLVAMKYEI